jgi:hypothetical protein
MAKAKPLSDEVWRAAEDPLRLLRHLRHHHAVSARRGGRRKLRLLGCAAARVVWDHLPNDHFRSAVEAAERHADKEYRRADVRAAHARTARTTESVFGLITDTYQTILAAFGMASPAYTRQAAAIDLVRELSADGFGVVRAMTAADAAVRLAVAATGERQNEPARRAAGRAVAHAVRDLFGDPHRPPAFAPHWRTTAALGLARSAHADRAFDLLPILADALEEAGCDEPDVLAHCRTGGPHARGCWVVDLVLGRHVFLGQRVSGPRSEVGAAEVSGQRPEDGTAEARPPGLTSDR